MSELGVFVIAHGDAIQFKYTECMAYSSRAHTHTQQQPNFVLKCKPIDAKLFVEVS